LITLKSFASTGANSRQITNLLDSISVHGDTGSFRFGLGPIDGRAQRHDAVHDDVREEYWWDIREATVLAQTHRMNSRNG
jgi:hypothetical protein